MVALAIDWWRPAMAEERKARAPGDPRGSQPKRSPQPSNTPNDSNGGRVLDLLLRSAVALEGGPRPADRLVRRFVDEMTSDEGPWWSSILECNVSDLDTSEIRWVEGSWLRFVQDVE